ncbi:hypothetical protein [Mesorhizobium sp. M0174]
MMRDASASCSIGLGVSGFLAASYGTVGNAIVGNVDVRSTTFVAAFG